MLIFQRKRLDGGGFERLPDSSGLLLESLVLGQHLRTQAGAAAFDGIGEAAVQNRNLGGARGQTLLGRFELQAGFGGSGFGGGQLLDRIVLIAAQLLEFAGDAQDVGRAFAGLRLGEAFLPVEFNQVLVELLAARLRQLQALGQLPGIQLLFDELLAKLLEPGVRLLQFSLLRLVQLFEQRTLLLQYPLLPQQLQGIDLAGLQPVVLFAQQLVLRSQVEQLLAEKLELVLPALLLDEVDAAGRGRNLGLRCGGRGFGTEQLPDIRDFALAVGDPGPDDVLIPIRPRPLDFTIQFKRFLKKLKRPRILAAVTRSLAFQVSFISLPPGVPGIFGGAGQERHGGRQQSQQNNASHIVYSRNLCRCTGPMVKTSSSSPASS